MIPVLTPKMIIEKDDKGESDMDKAIMVMRNHIIEAKIVQIMKSRKVENHNDLMDAVLRMITMFKPEPKLIKQRIENLIEREYLERHKDKKGTYVYKP